MSSLTKKGSDTHEHKYTKKAFKTVLLNEGSKTAKDKVLFNVCVELREGKVCGHKVAYDMERTVM